MGLMKLSLFVLLAVVAIAPYCSVATLSESSTKDWTRAYGAPDYAFFGGYTPSVVADQDTRRLLFQYGIANKEKYANKYLSYEALRKNNIPCGRRGHSYYNCNKKHKANPYRRGCTAITGCARFTD